MRVLLVAPPLMDRVDGRLRPIAMDAYRECPPYGVYLLASTLRAHGHEVHVADLIAPGTERLDAWFASIRFADLVGIGTSSLSWPTARECIAQVRRVRPDVPIVLGGIHATMFDRYVLSTSDAGFVVRGEAEAALPALCRVLERGGDLRWVPNLTFRLPDGTIVRTEVGPKLSPAQIAAHPPPDYGEVPPGVYNGLGIESSRGCPFDCSFCSTSYRGTYRPLDPVPFVDRLERILPHLPRTRGGTIQIIDDEFSVRTRRAIAICREIDRRGLRPRLVFDSRANDLLNEEFVDAVAPHALQFLVGAECGYDEGLERVGKKTTCEKLTRAAATLERRGLAGRADFSFVLGFPWETKTEVLRTVRFACGLYARHGVRVLLQWYCQIPGSRLWDEARRSQAIHEAQYDDFGFFHDLYLFRTGVGLTPGEIDEVSETVAPVLALSRLGGGERRMIEYAHPEPIARFFPRAASANGGDGALSSLREVSGARRS